MAAASGGHDRATSLDDFPLVQRIVGLNRKSPVQAYAPCPAHPTSHDSLSVGIMDNGQLGLRCFAGCHTGDILKSFSPPALWSDLYYSGTGSQSPRHHPDSRSHSTPSASQKTRGGSAHSRRSTRGPIIDIFPFRDESGELLFQECRHEPKEFTLRQPHPKRPSTWLYNITNPPVRRVLYRLPELLAAIANASPDDPVRVFFPEGAGKANWLANSGLVATTIAGGAASTWIEEYSTPLIPCRVYLLRDYDPPNPKTGRRAGDEAINKRAAALFGKVAFLAELILPPIGHLLPPDKIAQPGEKWDIIDWFKAGGTQEQFFQAISLADAHPWNPDAPENQAYSTPVPPDTPNEADDDPHRLARLYLNQQSHTDGTTLRFWRESYYRWDGRAYRELKTFEVKSELTATIKREFDRINLEALTLAASTGTPAPESQKVTTRLIGDSMQALAGMTLLLGHIEQPSWLDETGQQVDLSRHARDYISMSNGILNVSSLLEDHPEPLLPHSPRFFSPITIHYPFVLDSPCPTWLRFIDHNLEGDTSRISMLQEWFGYCLTFDTSYQKFLMMEGEGSNGKSVICAALTALLGPENVSHVSLELFGKDFELTQTLGRLANIVYEVGEIDRMAEGIIKSFTSGDRMTFNRKHKSLIEALPTARLILATNNRPRFSDKSGGIWRRLLLLPLNVTIAEDDPDRIHGMDQSTFWERSGELPGMFSWAVDGLARLREQKRFTQSDLSVKALDDYRAESNPARMFLRQFYQIEPNSDVVTAEVYDKYKTWADQNNYRQLSSNMFGKEIQRLFPGAKQGKVVRRVTTDNIYGTDKRFSGWTGIGEKPDEVQELSRENSF